MKVKECGVSCFRGKSSVFINMSVLLNSLSTFLMEMLLSNILHFPSPHTDS